MRKKAIFIHAAILKNSKERILQYLSIIKESKLMSYVNEINICFIGNEEIPIKMEDLHDYNAENKINLLKLSNDLHDYEIPTLQYLYQFCMNNPEYNILYLHTKNVGKEINQCIEDQIKYMLHFNVIKWKICEEILEKYSTCGVDLRNEPMLHYSGNFWWANASYISRLPSPKEFNNLEKYPNPLHSLRHNQEFWICYNNNHYSLWDCGINCYERHLHVYPEENYVFV
jgi:hypothetical protein